MDKLMNNSRRHLWLGAAIVLGIALGVGVVKWKGAGGDYGKPREAVKQLRTLEDSSVDALKQSVATGQSPENLARQISNYSDQLGAAAASLGPEERKPILAAQRVFAEMTPQMAAYEKAFKELDAAGGSSPATLASQDAIRQRIEMVNRFKAANHALLEFYRSVESRYRSELDKEGLSNAVKLQVMKGFRNGACVDVNLEIRESDAGIASTLLKMLELLNREWGQWKLRADGELIFDQDVALTQYHVLQDELRAVSARQQASQQELLNRAEQQQKSVGSR